jgi:hypothetical protein
MKHTQRLLMLVVLCAIAVCVPARADACDTRLEDAIAAKLEPSDHRVGDPRAAGRVVARAVAAVCHDSVMVDDDHYREATWALGSCELDAVALLLSAWDEGHFCRGSGPSCPRGDHGHSVGMFQVGGYVMGQWDSELTDRLEADLDAQARAAYESLRWGAKTCPDEPLAPYCGGCNRTGAREMAHARLAHAQDLLASLEQTP